jgi:hypothetical protein
MRAFGTVRAGRGLLMWETGLNEATVVVEETARFAGHEPFAQFRAVKSIAEPPARQAAGRGLRQSEQSHAVDEQHLLQHIGG